MPDWLLYTLLVIGSYLLGAVPFGWLFAKARKGVDLRMVGSGSIGATNAARVIGTGFFFLVMLLDAAKGLVPVAIGKFAFNDLSLAALMGTAAILGHLFSVYISFRGGKGTATGAGAFGMLLPVSVVIAVGVFLLVLLIFRYVSLGSIIGSLALSGSYIILQNANFTGQEVCAVAAFLVPVLVIFKHRSNIKRLFAGKEPRVGKPKA